MSMAVLADELVDLATQLRGKAEPLTLGGGFGLYLKQRHLETKPEYRALILTDLWPPARATEDIDLLLSTEVVLDAAQMKAVRSALDVLGYVPSVEFMQFVKQTSRGPVKVDLLTGPIPEQRNREARGTLPRVRPVERVGLHAYHTPEAIDAEVGSIEIPLTHSQSGDSAKVRIAGPFTLILMKLHAFRDRIDDPRKDLAQHHALDLYRVIAMLDRSDFALVRERFGRQAARTEVQASAAVIDAHFADEDGLGVLRMLTYVRERMPQGVSIDTAAFIAALRDLTKG